MKNIIFWDIKTQFILHRRHITSPAGLCSGKVIYLLRGTNWILISQKTGFFIVTAAEFLIFYI
jgi:hypothetical protein